jgi:hypothetical protein
MRWLQLTIGWMLIALVVAATSCAANTCPLARQAHIACSGNLWHVEGIPNLGRVRLRVYRSGQPATAEDWVRLKRVLERDNLSREIHINVVKLNEEAEGSDAPAELLGMRVIRIPMPPSTLRWLSVFERPPPEAMARLRAVALEIRENLGPGNEPPARASGARSAGLSPRLEVYLYHCQNGHDRTGFGVISERVWAEGWDPLAAYEEAREWGLHIQIPGLSEARRFVR